MSNNFAGENSVSDILLTVDKLSVVYQQRGGQPVEAVKGVSLVLRRGESFGIVGESGCGKSSLARAIVGLVKPVSGSVCFTGVESSEPGSIPRRKFCQSVQMIFQDATGSLNPRMQVEQILAEVLLVHRIVTREEVGARVSHLMELVGLPANLAGSYPRELSGGQCQRVSIARCLAVGPSLIIADEPVSALDVSVQARILNLLRELQQQLDLTLLLISHDFAVVRNLCDQVAVMWQGEFVEQGSTGQVITRPSHSYTQSLLAAVPDVGRALARE